MLSIYTVTDYAETGDHQDVTVFLFVRPLSSMSRKVNTLLMCMRVSVALSTHCCYLFSSIQLARSMIVSTKWCLTQMSILLAVVKCRLPDGS